MRNDSAIRVGSKFSAGSALRPFAISLSHQLAGMGPVQA